MANQKKAWVLAPSFDIRPDGVLGLGSILASPSSPEPINPSSRVPPDPSHVYESYKTNFQSEIAKRNEKKPGIWTAFLANLGLSRDAHLSEDTTRYVYTFDKLVTRSFEPSTEYLERCLRSGEVQEFLKSGFGFSGRRPLYLVTGIQIAIGAPSATASKGGDISLRVSVPGLGPSFADVGASISVSRDFGRSTTITTSPTDYIFAIRLQKIDIVAKREVTSKESTKGASIFGTVETGDSEDVDPATFLVWPDTAQPSDTPTDKIEPPNQAQSPQPGKPDTSYSKSDVASPTTDKTMLSLSEAADDPHLQPIAVDVDDETDPTIEVLGRFRRASRSSSVSSAFSSLFSQPAESQQKSDTEMDSDDEDTEDVGKGNITAEKAELEPNPGIPYYNGIKAALKLIASTNSTAEDPVRNPSRDTTDAGYSARKRFFPVGKHPINDQWEKLVQTHIIPMGLVSQWAAVYCVRLGYQPIAKDNPVVILVLINPDSTSVLQGQEYIQKIKDGCESCGVDISNIDIEVAEATKISGRAGGHGDPHVLKGPFDKKVYIGASIGPRHNDSAGSFAAYLSANYRGKEILLALTCDHVCFDPKHPPKEADSNRVFKFEKTPTEYIVDTPARWDFENTRMSLDDTIMEASDTIDGLRSRLGPLDPPEDENRQITSTKENQARATTELESLEKAKKILGFVYGTGGARKEGDVPMDWGTVRPPDDDAVLNTTAELNMLPDIAFSTVDILPDINRRLSALQKPRLHPLLGLPRDSFPGSIPSQISLVRTHQPKPDEVFFKVGRTTGWTAGVYNSCRSVHFRPKESTIVQGSKDQHYYSDYNFCLMWCFIGVANRPFGDSGDSGSMIFDRKGRAMGLYCSGIEGTVLLPDISNAIPLDTVLEDIEKQLDLHHVRLANAPRSPAAAI